MRAPDYCESPLLYVILSHATPMLLSLLSLIIATFALLAAVYAGWSFV